MTDNDTIRLGERTDHLGRDTHGRFVVENDVDLDGKPFDPNVLNRATAFSPGLEDPVYVGVLDVEQGGRTLEGAFVITDGEQAVVAAPLDPEELDDGE